MTAEHAAAGHWWWWVSCGGRRATSRPEHACSCCCPAACTVAVSVRAGGELVVAAGAFGRRPAGRRDSDAKRRHPPSAPRSQVAACRCRPCTSERFADVATPNGRPVKDGPVDGRARANAPSLSLRRPLHAPNGRGTAASLAGPRPLRWPDARPSTFLSPSLSKKRSCLPDFCTDARTRRRHVISSRP